MAEKSFLNGDRFTVADAYLFSLTGWEKADWLKSVYHLDLDFSEFTHLATWYQRILNRQAVQDAIKYEDITV